MKQYVGDSVILVSIRNKKTVTIITSTITSALNERTHKIYGLFNNSNVESSHTSFSDWRSIGNNTTWLENCTLLSYKVPLVLTAPITTTMTIKMHIDSFTHMRISEVMYIWKIMNDPLAHTTSAHASIGNRYGLATPSPDGRAMAGCGPWEVCELSWRT